MATNYNPRIITDNLVFLVDAGNVKSYAGDVISETAGPAYGYYGGGQPSPTAVSTVDRIDYSNDTPTTPAKGPLSAARYGLAAASSRANGLPTTETRSASAPQGTNYGYITGGGTGTQTSVVRIDYDNDTAIAVQKGPLSAGAGYMTGVGNLSYAYQGGGFNSGVKSSISRMDYSNDTATSVSGKGPLSLARRAPSATGNADYGYFGGGPDPYYLSLVDRIDYSSDTPTATAKGPLSAGRRGIAAASGLANGLPNSATYAYRSASIPLGTPYAWIVGGAPGNITSFERIDYDNDTATTSTRGALSGAKPYGGGVGNISYAYIGGGYSGSNLSTIDRIDYSSDTPTASPKGPLTVARGYIGFGAAGNSSYGYISGGFKYPPGT